MVMINIAYKMAITRFVYKRNRSVVSRRILLREGKRNQTLLMCLLSFQFVCLLPILCYYILIFIFSMTMVKVIYYISIPETLYYSTSFYIYALYVQRRRHGVFNEINRLIQKIKKKFTNSISPAEPHPEQPAV
ncbi:unnamed protein product [Gordionus sp. m RMFG-2023]